MGSIQSAINQGISVATALYSQSPSYEAKKQAKIDNAELAKIDKSIQANQELKTSTEEVLTKKIKANERLINKLSKGEATKDVKEAISQAQAANVELGKIKEQNIGDINKDYEALLKRKGNILGNYSESMAFKADEAIQRAEAIKTNKLLQKKNVASKLSVLQSLGQGV